MALAMVCLFIPAKTLHAASGRPENPHYDTNGNPEWDYVYFGKYPQSEVDMNEIPEVTESKLRNAVYNVNGDAVIDGIKYRRVAYYDEDDYDCTTKLYRYFRYDPIKWRVLNNSGRSLLLLSDSCLLYEYTNAGEASNNPEYATSKHRSVLNGYRDAENTPGIDYSQKGTNFYSMAFTKSEQEILEKQTLPEDVGKTDYITIPTEKQISNVDYGFQNAADRAAGGSDYLKFFYSQLHTVDENFPIGYDVLRTSRHVLYNCNSQTFSDRYQGILRPVITISLNSDLWSMENPGNTFDAMDISLADLNMPRDTFTYNGKACEPVITSAKYNSENLEENIDYTCSYDNNINAGEASVIIQGTGDFTGTKTIPFSIRKAAQQFSLPQQEYSMLLNDPDFRLNPALIQGDGFFSYQSDNTDVVSVNNYGTVSINGCGNATLTVTVGETSNYNSSSEEIDIIVKAEIKSADIDLSDYTFIYNGTAHKPNIHVSFDGKSLTEGIDFNLSYSNNINAGTANVIIEGTGDYIGSITKPFTISKASQSFNIQQKYQKTYGDKSFKLNPKPRNGNGAFTYNTSNSKVAKVSKNGAVTITGCGKAVVTTTMKASNNYKQTQQKTTIIVVPKKATLSKPQSKAKGQLMLKWKKTQKHRVMRFPIPSTAKRKQSW